MENWEICCNCSGEGKHSNHIGAITSSELSQDWSDEDLESYKNGAYDKSCAVCYGTGKVRESKNRVEIYYATDEEYYRKREGGY